MSGSHTLKLDRNGYAPSLLDTESGACYLCGRRRDTVRHEIYFGTGNRKLAKAAGLWANLCTDCHARVHADKKYDEFLKNVGYEVYTREHSPEEFYKLFRRYY